MPTVLPARRLLLWALLLSTLLAASARADEHRRESAAEVNAFVKLSDVSRLFLLGSLTRQQQENVTDGEVGAYLDFTIKPILREQLRTANWQRDRYLWVRVGYGYTDKVSGNAQSSPEKRVVLEGTARFELPKEMWLASRLRADLRDIDGTSSQRYRLRLAIEREFTVNGTAVVPLRPGETFYDTRFDTWNRQHYQTGVEIELSKQWRIEPYVSRQNDNRSASGNVDTAGLVLKYFH